MILDALTLQDWGGMRLTSKEELEKMKIEIQDRGHFYWPRLSTLG